MSVFLIALLVISLAMIVYIVLNDQVKQRAVNVIILIEIALIACYLAGWFKG